MNIYDWNEIVKHNHENDCWIVANGYVYNVTDFIKNHPAGSKSIINKAGTDCTIDFDFHSKKAQINIWKPYRIGKLKGYKFYSCTIM